MMEQCSHCHGGHRLPQNSLPRLSTSGQIILAIESCNEVWIKSLLEFPDKNFDIHDGSLCYASEKGHVGIMLALLNAGADPDQLSHQCKKRPVHFCADNGHQAGLAVLVSHGADINQIDGHERMVMHFVALRGHAEMAKYLAEHGALTDEVDTDGYSPLHLASCLGHTAVCKTLLTQGGADVNRRTKDGWSPLHMAASYGHKELVEMLFSFGADLEGRTAEGESSLHIACAKGFSDIVIALLNYEAQVESRTNQGATPLHLAVCMGHQDIVCKLIKSGASVNFQSLPAVSCPVNVAAIRGDKNMLHLLVSAGCVVSRESAVVMHNCKFISAQDRDCISRFPSLRDLCFWKIRLLLAPLVQCKALDLPIPKIFKDLLTFRHLQREVNHRF